MQIAFIGLGNMGGAMAGVLTRSGRTVVAFDLASEAIERAVSAGCIPARSVAEAVKGADAVMTMLPAGAQARAVYSREVFPNVTAGALLVDCSTIDVESARVLAGEAQAKGLRFADAPVSGGVIAAAAGSLAFMVGCREEDFVEIGRLVEPLARAVIRAGDPGAGQAAKICNNMVLGVSMIGVCEAFALVERLGLDGRLFFDIASQSTAQCWSLTSHCPWPGPVPHAPSNRGYEAGFSAAMMLKDLKLAQEAAAISGAAAPIGAAAEGLYALFGTLGGGEMDFSAIIELFRGRAPAADAAAVQGYPAISGV